MWTHHVYLIKDETLFMLYGRNNFEEKYEELTSKGAKGVLEPTTEPWGQRTCYIADPEGNLIEIGSWNKPFFSWSDKDM